MFLKSAEKLGIEPSQCAVVEDAKSGIDAARAAGVISAGMMLAGTMSPVVETFSGIVSGVPRKILRVLLLLTPDLYGMESQSGKYLLGETTDVHRLLGASCFCI